LGRVPAEFSHGLHLLIGFDCVAVAHGGWLSAMGGFGLQAVVERDPASDANPGL
jgi:hypothetical protein